VLTILIGWHGFRVDHTVVQCLFCLQTNDKFSKEITASIFVTVFMTIYLR
jgi:hypothetical protein